jgi:type II secretory pathway component PulK
MKIQNSRPTSPGQSPGGRAKFKIQNFERGQALVLTVLLLAVVLAIALAISNIFAVEVRLAGDVTESVKAVMAADSGIEWMLFKERKVLPEDPPPSFNGQACGGTDCLLDNGASFSVTKTTDGGTALVSIGALRNTKRGLRVSY